MKFYVKYTFVCLQNLTKEGSGQSKAYITCRGHLYVNFYIATDGFHSYIKSVQFSAQNFLMFKGVVSSILTGDLITTSFL